MKKLSIIYLLLLAPCLLFAQENYTLQINGKNINIALDKTYQVDINGKKANVSLKQKQSLEYEHEQFKVSYPKKYSITQTKLDEGIEQIMIMNASGTGLLIQYYSIMDPSLLKPILLKEILKESISYGYKKNAKTRNRTFKSGEKISTDDVTMTYKDETNKYEIGAYSISQDEGIIILSMIMATDIDEDAIEDINTIWQSIEIKD